MKNKISKKRWAIFVPETIPSFSGSGINAYNFARYMNKKDFKVNIITLNRNLKLKSRNAVENVMIFRTPYIAANKITKMLSLLTIIPQYLYFILKNELIFVYGAHIIGYQLIIILSHVFKRKMVFRSTIFKEDDIYSLIHKKITGKLNKYALKIIDIYFSLNPAFSASYLKVFADNSKILETPQGVDDNYFYPATVKQKNALRKKLGLNAAEPIIISVGYLINRKGYEEIFIQLSKISYKFLYIIAGDFNQSKGHFQTRKEISEMQYLYNRGKDLLHNKIKFVGARSNICDYLRAADLFVHNAYKEGLPNVLLEAMACGLPVITRKIESLSGYLISHMNNALEFEDPRDIPLYITNCINDPGLANKLAKNARNTITDSFTYNIISRKLIDKL